jgi:hypothetical protein
MEFGGTGKSNGYTFAQEPSAIGTRGKGKYRDPFAQDTKYVDKLKTNFES